MELVTRRKPTVEQNCSSKAIISCNEQEQVWMHQQKSDFTMTPDKDKTRCKTSSWAPSSHKCLMFFKILDLNECVVRQKSFQILKSTNISNKLSYSWSY